MFRNRSPRPLDLLGNGYNSLPNLIGQFLGDERGIVLVKPDFAPLVGDSGGFISRRDRRGRREDYEDEPDVDYFIRNYQPDALCLAAFCLGVGIGWKKDVVSSKRLYEAALAQGYPRASYYLKEIDSGHV